MMANTKDKEVNQICGGLLLFIIKEKTFRKINEFDEFIKIE